MSDPALVEFNLYIPPELLDAIVNTAKNNRRSISAEITVAAEHYIGNSVQNKTFPPVADYIRLHIRIPEDIHQRIVHIAEVRRWKINHVYLDAMKRHIVKER